MMGEERELSAQDRHRVRWQAVKKKQKRKGPGEYNITKMGYVQARGSTCEISEKLSSTGETLRSGKA